MNGPLADDQTARFHADGYLVCPGLLGECQHAAVKQMVEEIAAWPASPQQDRWQHYRELTDNGPVLARTENFLPFHDDIRRWLCEGLLSEAVGQLFGEPAVVFKEKINYKQPGGGGFAPHQDARAYAYGQTHITCLVAVDDNTVDNGCLWFSPAAHRDGLLETGQDGCLSDDLAGALSWVAAPVAAGGVTFFSSYAPHKSDANRSCQPRRSLYVTYNRASEGDLRKAYYEERSRSMSQQDASGPSPRISTIGHFQGRGAD